MQTLIITKNTMDIYVQSKSKKAINEKLANNEIVSGYHWSILGGGHYFELDEKLPVGTVIKVYEKLINGNPYAKSYGVWDGKKVK
jgi:hypothetical protein